jgi:enterochelin esterase family protein
VIPLVEGKYRVMNDRAHRALFGLSQGGAATLATGLNHPEAFSQIAAFSTGGPQADIEKRLLPALEHGDRLNAQLGLVWMGCGRQDSLYAENESLAKLLADHGVKATFHSTDGVHNWSLWREYLHETAPLLFRATAKQK